MEMLFLHHVPPLVHRPVNDRFRPGGWSVDKPGRWTRGGMCVAECNTSVIITCTFTIRTLIDIPICENQLPQWLPLG